MRNQIELLTALQELDREMREKKHAKEVLLAELKKGADEIAEKKALVAVLRAEWEEKDKLRQDKERTLQEESKRAMDKRMHMGRIKNVKEMQSLQREIDHIKQGNTQMEEELIALMEELEARAAPLRQKSDELAQAQDHWTKKRAEADAQCAEIDDVLARASEMRREIAAQINGELVNRYDLIFARRGGMAVVAVADGTCQGCYMHIPPQLLNEILKGERLNVCPSCHRILYYKPTVPSSRQA